MFGLGPTDLGGIADAPFSCTEKAHLAQRQTPPTGSEWFGDFVAVRAGLTVPNSESPVVFENLSSEPLKSASRIPSGDLRFVLLETVL